MQECKQNVINVTLGLMIKITDVVREIVYSSEVSLAALAGGYLNLSAYAKTIRRETERIARKPVRVGSIVVALSRLARVLKKEPALVPDVFLENLSAKSGLIELAFDKTKENQEKLQLLYRNKNFAAADFYTLTHSVGEISIVVPEHLHEVVLNIFKGKEPKFFLDNLASLTIRFSDEYINTPNVIYSFLRHLVPKRINIVEIVSTYTELTFIVDQGDLNLAFITLNQLLQRQRRGASR